MPIDVGVERRLTPGASRVAHLNNAGASLPAQPTLDAVIDHLHLEATIGGYEAAAERAPALEAVRASAARLVGADPDEIAVTGSDTQAWSKAFWGFVLAGGVAERQRVLVDRASYVSHFLAILQASRHVGFRVDVVPSVPDGTIDLDALGDHLRRGDVAMVSATHVGTHRGSVNPVEDIGLATRAAGVPFFVDVCQSIGQRPVDVERMACDVATATGRKWLRAPRGTGLLYVRRAFADQLDPIGIDGRSATWTSPDTFELAPGARRFEEFEVSCAGELGLGAAIDHALRLGIDDIAARVGQLAEGLRHDLEAIDGVTVLDGGQERAAIVTFVRDGVSADSLARAARAASINVGISAAPWARLDMDDPGRTEVLRVSPHYFNELDELFRLVEVVQVCRPQG